MQANASQCTLQIASKQQIAYLQLRQASKLMQAAIANKLQMQASKANASKCLANAHCNSQQATKLICKQMHASKQINANYIVRLAEYAS